jgi:hypothetical protein
MSSRPATTIAKQLVTAQVAITNSLSDKKILQLLSDYGYTATRLREGQKLYEAARQAVNAKTSLSGGQQDATAGFNKAFKAAQAAYQSLAKVARALWLHDKPKLAALGLSGKMPATTAGFITAAYKLFDNAANDLAAAKDLADYGYTKAKLAAERKKIETCEKADQSQEAAKGEAQDAARAQDRALKELNAWMARFIKIAREALVGNRELLEKIGVLARSGKTKKQRRAPSVASATRAAKKQANK